MNIHEIIAHRESIRNYDPSRPVDETTLRRILEAGRLAPSACNRQPWEFLVVRSPEALARVRTSYGAPWFQDAPQVLAVVGDRRQAWVHEEGFNSLETDLAIAMDHIILAATAEGVGTCWIAHFDTARLKQALGLNPGQEVFTITPLGYPRPDFARKGAKTRKAFEEVVKYL